MIRNSRNAARLVAVMLMVVVVGSGAVVFGTQATQPARPESQPAPGAGPRDAQTRDKFAAVVAQTIGRAHGYSAWRTKQAVQAEIQVEEGGNVIIDGVMTYDIRGNRSRLDLKDGTVVVFDGRQAWVAPASAEFADARYHVQRWPWFFAAAFRMQDRGMVHTQYAERSLRNKRFDSLMLSYQPGMGDWPGDWFLCFAESKEHELRAMAYITTYGRRPRQEAEQDIRAIVFDSYNTVEGTILPVQCSIWRWNANQGIHGEQVGSAQFSNIKYVELQPAMFEKPADAREDVLQASSATQPVQQ